MCCLFSASPKYVTSHVPSQEKNRSNFWKMRDRRRVSSLKLGFPPRMPHVYAGERHPEHREGGQDDVRGSHRHHHHHHWRAAATPPRRNTEQSGAQDDQRSGHFLRPSSPSGGRNCQSVSRRYASTQSGTLLLTVSSILVILSLF